MNHHKKPRRALHRNRLAHPGPAFEYERQGTFRFTDLPPELRNIIYEYAFAGSTSRIKASKRSRSYIVRYTTPRLTNNVDFPVLLLACKQLRAEATPIYYANTTVSASKETHLTRWLGAVEPGFRKLVKLVEFDYIVDTLVHDPGVWELMRYKWHKGLDLKKILGRLEMLECGVEVKVVRYRDRKVLWPEQEAQSWK